MIVSISISQISESLFATDLIKVMEPFVRSATRECVFLCSCRERFPVTIIGHEARMTQ